MSRILLTDVVVTPPTDPSAGQTAIYSKTAGGGLFYKQGSDPEIGPLAVGGGGSTLQTAYIAGSLINVTTAHGPVIVENNSDGEITFVVSRDPGSSQSGNGIYTVMGANTTGDGVFVLQTGSGRGLFVDHSGTAAGTDGVVARKGFAGPSAANAILADVYNAGSTGPGVRATHRGSGAGVLSEQSGSGSGVRVDQSGTGPGVEVRQTGAGNAIQVSDPGATTVFTVNNAGTVGTPRLVLTDPSGATTPDLSIRGDLGGTNPIAPRIETAGGIPLGYIPRTLPFAFVSGFDLNTLTSYPTVFLASLASPQSVTLPDARKYPSGTEIVFYNDSSVVAIPTRTLTVLAAGAGGATTNINGPIILDQFVLPGQTKRFLNASGNGWYVSREDFTSTTVEVPLSSGNSQVDLSGNSLWRYDGSFSWVSLLPPPPIPNNFRYLNFPLNLPIGANILRVYVAVETAGVLPVVANRLTTSLIKNDVNWITGATTATSLGSVVQGSLSYQVLQTPVINHRVEATSSYMIRVGHTGTNPGSTFTLSGLRVYYSI